MAWPPAAANLVVSAAVPPGPTATVPRTTLPSRNVTVPVGPGGTATFTTSFAAAGGHAITAFYSGAPNFVASSSQALTEQVSAARQASPFDSLAVNYLSAAYSNAYYAYYYGSHSASAYYAYLDSYYAYAYAQQAASTHSASDWYSAYAYAAAAAANAYQDYAASGNGYAYYAYAYASYGSNYAYNAYAYYARA